MDYYHKGQLVCWTDIDNELIKCVQVNKTGGVVKDHREVFYIGCVFVKASNKEVMFEIFIFFIFFF